MRVLWTLGVLVVVALLVFAVVPAAQVSGDQNTASAVLDTGQNAMCSVIITSEATTTATAPPANTTIRAYGQKSTISTDTMNAMVDPDKTTAAALAVQRHGGTTDGIATNTFSTSAMFVIAITTDERGGGYKQLIYLA